MPKPEGERISAVGYLPFDFWILAFYCYGWRTSKTSYPFKSGTATVTSCVKTAKYRGLRPMQASGDFTPRLF